MKGCSPQRRSWSRNSRTGLRGWKEGWGVREETGKRAGESGKRRGAADRGEGGSGGPREERKSRGLMLHRENPACSELTVSPWSEQPSGEVIRTELPETSGAKDRAKSRALGGGGGGGGEHGLQSCPCYISGIAVPLCTRTGTGRAHCSDGEPEAQDGKKLT